MKLKVITIDFWNTLFDSGNGEGRNKIRQKAFIEEIDLNGLFIKKHEFDEALKASWDYFNRTWKNEHRTPLPSETIEFFWNYLKLPDNQKSIERLTKVFAESILEYPPSLIPGVKEVLKEFYNRFELGIISDTGFSPGIILRELMKRNDIFKYFKYFSFSDETGVSKPHPKAYLKILDEFNCKPSESLHIGDIERTDIAGAKELGMKAILFSGDRNSILNDDSIHLTKADSEAKTWFEISEFVKNFNSIN